MKECRSKSYQLTKKLTPLLVLDCKIDTVLSAAIYYLNEFMESERTSIFIFQAWKQELTVFSSLDLEKHEISLPKSSGVSGWVFENRAPAIINNAYQDNRFFKGVDEMTGFYTRNIICTPMIDRNNCCLGTLQSLNKKEGSFDSDDLEIIDLTAHLVAISISNSKCYNEITSTNAFQKKVIDRFMDAINDAKTTYPMW